MVRTLNNTSLSQAVFYGCGEFILGIGVYAGIGAGIGATGSTILISNGWNPGISVVEFTQAMCVGTTIFGIPHMAAIIICGLLNVEYDLKSIHVCSIIGFALSGMLGSWILGQLENGELVGFAAAGGVVGTSVLALGVLGLACSCVGIATCMSSTINYSVSRLMPTIRVQSIHVENLSQGTQTAAYGLE